MPQTKSSVTNCTVKPQISSSSPIAPSTDTRTVRHLNARYLGLDEPTDVLAFNTDIPGLRDPHGVAELGALIIALPVAARPPADELH